MNDQQGVRRRYATFDAMRGVAALAVVVGHYDQVMQTDWPPYFFLAVDLFFLLSGFVLALNYDRRFADGMTALQFMRLRAIRLWPLVLIGAASGLFVQVNWSVPLGRQLHSFVSFVLTCFALPSPPPPGSDLLFPINTAFWTLLMEFWVANLAFAVLWRWLRGPGLWLVIGAGLAGLIWSERVYYDLAVGWGWHNAGVGLARVTFSFFAGVALARRFPEGLPWVRLPSWVLVADLLALFFLRINDRFSGVISLVYVVVLIPLLVLLGAGARERYPKAGSVLGDASYAVYAIHYPLIVEFADLVTPQTLAHAPHHWRTYNGVLVAFLVGTTLTALAVDRWVDRPMRRWLSRVVPRTTPATSAGSAPHAPP